MAVLKEWLKYLKYEILKGTDEAEVFEVVFDSRKIIKDCVFVCIGGSRIDSHSFIKEASERGCTTFIVEKDISELELPKKKINIIRVDNSRSALAYISQARFGYPAKKMYMIGITGTKGKTTTANIIASVLSMNGKKTGVIGTNGCFIDGRYVETKNTTPESYELHMRFSEMLEAGCEYVVMECSSQGFKMHRTDGISFDSGIFLNISPDHIGPLEHKDFDEYMHCKAQLLNQSKQIFINIDDMHAAELLQIYASEHGIKLDNRSNINTILEKLCSLSDCKFRGFSIKNKTDIWASDIKYTAGNEFVGSLFTIHKNDEIVYPDVKMSMPGDFNVLNALAAVSVISECGIDPKEYINSFIKLNVKGRMETVYRSEHFQVIVDYAHNEVSMQSLLNTLRKYEPKRLVVVFGCGGNRSADRRTGMGSEAARSADLTILTADNSRFEKTEDIISDIRSAYLAAGGSKDRLIEIPDRRSAIRYAMSNAKDGDMIAVIGKGHEEYQEENGLKTHFSDKEEILKAAAELGL